MKKLLAALKARFKQPKWRHGKLSALLTAGLLAFCVLVNVGVGALEDEYGWRQDMSFNGYATTGEETKRALGALERDVELYLLYQSGDRDEQVMQVLERYEAQSEHVKVLPTDIARNPGILTQFKGDADSEVAADSVVVSCQDTGRYEVLSPYDFFTEGYNIEAGAFEAVGLAYEKKLTEAIVYVTQESVPTVGILQGHGELTLEALQTLTDFLRSNGYDIIETDLIRGDALDAVDMLLIANPQNDLGDAELQTIASFAQGGGSLFVVRDYTDPLTGMDNYLSLLRGYGVIPLPGVVVASTEDAGSYYTELLYLLPYLTELDMTVPLISGGMDVLLMPGACAFETPAESDNTLSVATVVKSGAHAYLRDPSDGNPSIEQQPGDRVGEMSLALIAQRTHASGDMSRMFAIGNSALLTDEYIYQRTDNEAFLMQVMGEMLPQKSVSLDIMASTAFRPALTAGSQTLGVALLVALPLMIAMAALCVLLPRKNK